MNVRAIKATVRERDGYRCTLCGRTNEQHLALYGSSLQVHRLIPGSPYTVEGCSLLCIPCHGPQPRSYRSEHPRRRNPDRATLYVSIPETLRRRFVRLARKRKRKITAELTLALQRYLAAEGSPS